MPTRTINEQFGIRLRQLRQARDLTQAELAHRAELQTHHITNLESGKGDPKLGTIASIAQGLNVEPIELLIAPSASFVFKKVVRSSPRLSKGWPEKRAIKKSNG